jgi:hypothetical protein
MSNIFIADIVGIGTYAVPVDDAALTAATAGLDTLLSGIAGLTYDRVLSWVETSGGAGASRRLSCLIEKFSWNGDECPGATEICSGTGTGISEQIQTTLEADPSIVSIGTQQYNLFIAGLYHLWGRDTTTAPGQPFLYPATTGDNVVVDGSIVQGTGIAPTNASCGIELSSTTQALLPSRMTTAQRATLTAVDGMIVYDSDEGMLRERIAGEWMRSVVDGAADRTFYVRKSGSATGTGARNNPFLTIQAAVDAAALLVPAPDTTHPAVVDVGVGVWVENVIHDVDGLFIVGKGPRSTMIDNPTGHSYTFTNATRASIVTYNTSGVYSDLINNGSAGPIFGGLFDIGIKSNAAGKHSIRLLGVKGDSGAGLRTNFGSYQIYIINVFSLQWGGSGANGFYARNTGGIFIFNSYIVGPWSCFNCSSVGVMNNNMGGYANFDYDSADPDGQPTAGRGTTTLRQLPHLDLNISGEVYLIGDNCGFYDVMVEDTAYFLPMCSSFDVLDFNDTAVIVINGGYARGSLSIEGGVTAEINGLTVHGVTTIDAGAGVVTASNCVFTGTVVDPSKKMVRTGELQTSNARTGFPSIDGLNFGAAAGLAVNGSVDLTIIGSNLLQTQTFATLLIGTFLRLSAVVPGSVGNSLHARVVDTGVGGLAVSYVAPLLTVDQGGSASDEATVATAVNALAGVHGIIRADSTGTVGAVVPLTPETALAGGTGSGFTATIGGQPALIHHDTGATSVSNLTETAVLLVPHDLSAHGFAAQNCAMIMVVSNGIASNTAFVVLI